LAWRVFNGIETAANLARHFHFPRKTLNQSVKRLRKRGYGVGKRGRPYVIDEFAAVGAKEIYVFDDPDSDSELEDAIQDGYEMTLLDRTPVDYGDWVAAGKLPLVDRRTQNRYVKRLKASEYPFN
jgi:hypothetical protein